MHVLTTRRRPVLLAVLVLVSAVALPPATASAGPASNIGCSPRADTCHVTVSVPGTNPPQGALAVTGVVDPGTGTDNTGTGTGCSFRAKAVPCFDPSMGWYNSSDSCYYKALIATLPSDWAATGHTPADGGAIYFVMCEPTPLGPRGLRWLAAAPPGAPPAPPPAATLAQRALAQLRLPTLTAASNGGASATTYVGIPTWLWVSGAWRPLSATAAAGGRAVTLTATPTGTKWDMKDGTRGVECPGPGAPFNPADPRNPPCGYTYQISSIGQPQEGPTGNDRFFHVQAAAVFALHWVCRGACDEAAGDLADMSRPTTPMPLRVFEVQTVIVSN